MEDLQARGHRAHQRTRPLGLRRNDLLLPCIRSSRLCVTCSMLKVVGSVLLV